MSERLLIADGTVAVLRPWFSGQPNPWRPALAAVRALRREASHLAVVMDITIDTFRRELAPDYKAHRPPAPPDLIVHFDRFRAELEALGVPVFASMRYEADDLAAALARRAGEAGLPVAILSDDKDLFQLVREAPPLQTEDRLRGKVYDRAAVHAKMGVWPEQIVDYLSLVGDASDGVRGVAGVGATTATALLGALGSLDAIFADPGAAARLPIRGASTLPAKLQAGREAALLARELVRLRDDAPLPEDALARCRIT